MADKFHKNTKYHSTRDFRNGYSKRSREDTRNDSNESKTPPLPLRTSIEKLMKQRKSIKEELKNIAELKSKTEIKKDTKKRKFDDYNTNNSNSFNHNESIKIKKSDCKYKDSSPEYTQDYLQLDSEDEENIIEQRRQQRKLLIQQLHTIDTKTENNVENRTSNNLKELSTKESKVFSKEKSTKDVTDMFSEEDFAPKKDSSVTQNNSDENTQLKDNWDDSEGYYNIKVGDVINNRYTIKSFLGQGVFANVVRAVDNNKTYNEVAIKIIRSNDLMYKTGLKEVEMLKAINNADPDHKYHCVQFYTSFMHKGHLCMVLESLHMDLRSILKKYGKNHGINMKALISYSRQLLLSLRLLRKIGIVHADIKPDNILVNEKKNVLKLCDFGSAAKIDENEPTPYLVSRFYRAPEIILGITYKHSVDVWSTACTIYEMATGKILFTGSSNNKMLKCFMDLKGRIPSRIIRKGKFKDQHFNYNNNFLLRTTDEFSGREKVVELNNLSATRDLSKELKKSYKNLTKSEEKKIGQLKDLLDKMLMLDLNQRLSVTDCLRHPFLHEDLN